MTKSAKPPKLEEIGTRKHIDRDAYDKALGKLQTRLKQIQQAYLHTGDVGIVVFEGWDAAGKGGTIRRMSAVLDPRGFKVWPISAPRPHELEHHYLDRFWRRLPARGEIAVFDRSWYGRVLVERVEGYAGKKEWRRAYDEINRFEEMLADDGVRIVKIFLNLSRDEQLHRFQERLENPLKRWKLSYEDFRNRKKWQEYEEAADQMLARTHTDFAPWLVVPADFEALRPDRRADGDHRAPGEGREPGAAAARRAGRDGGEEDPELGRLPLRARRLQRGILSAARRARLSAGHCVAMS